MQSKRIVFLFIILIFFFGIFIPCELEPKFYSNEKWVPKEEITQKIQSFHQIRLIQLANWPSIKQQLYGTFPMIDKLTLSFASFPNIYINIKEKDPWAILFYKNAQKVFSIDGTLLNQKMSDVELPNRPILLINSNINILNSNKISDSYLRSLIALQSELKEIPLFKLQQIKLTSNNITLLEESGLQVNVGNLANITEKMSAFKYFLGSKRAQTKSYEFIDVQFPKRVIIK